METSLHESRVFDKEKKRHNSPGAATGREFSVVSPRSCTNFMRPPSTIIAKAMRTRTRCTALVQLRIMWHITLTLEETSQFLSTLIFQRIETYTVDKHFSRGDSLLMFGSRPAFGFILITRKSASL